MNGPGGGPRATPSGCPAVTRPPVASGPPQPEPPPASPLLHSSQSSCPCSCILTKTQGCLSGASPALCGWGRLQLLGSSQELDEGSLWPYAPPGPRPAGSCVPTPLTLAAVKIISSEKWMHCTTKLQRHIVQQEGYSQYFIITGNGI